MTAKGMRPLVERPLFKPAFAITLLATTALGGQLAFADADDFFHPGNLLLSKAVYDASPTIISSGVTQLPPGCAPANCVIAVFDGTYPFVFNNASGSIKRDANGNPVLNSKGKLWAITSTVSGSGDQGADPNKLVKITDQLSATILPANESFTTVRTAAFGEALRGVSFTPGTELDDDHNHEHVRGDGHGVCLFDRDDCRGR